jgi:4-amino-4-deoxy-L-arabinose transferase-like glycosyltransferase
VAPLRERWLAPIERRISSWYDRAGDTSATLILLGLFVAAWMAFHVITYAAIGLHPDLTEIYDWSRHPAAGYYKHPPLGALMAAAWFAIFPVADWSFHLLAMVNAAAALYAADLIARRYLSGDKRLMVLLLLLLLPFYQFHGQRFASNQTLLATWAFATYFFLRAFETRAVAWSVAAGVMAALAMLGKYYSIYLIGGLIAAALMHPLRARYLTSASPWISAAVGALMLAPHVYWLTTTGFQPFAYAYAVHGSPSLADVVASAASYLAGSAGYAALPVAVYWLAVRPDRATLAAALWPADANRRLLVVALAGYLLLPALLAPLFGVLINSLWSMPAYFLLPVVLLAPPSAVLTRRAAVFVALGVLAFTAVAVLAIAPARAWINFRNGASDDRGFSRKLSEEVTRAWRTSIGRPLTIVLGDSKLNTAVAFYSPDHPDAVPQYNFSAAPWVTPERLAAEGWAAVCRAEDAACLAPAERLSAHEPRARRSTVEIVPRFLGYAGTPARFTIVIVPPRSFASRTP